MCLGPNEKQPWLLTWQLLTYSSISLSTWLYHQNICHVSIFMLDAILKNVLWNLSCLSTSSFTFDKENLVASRMLCCSSNIGKVLRNFFIFSGILLFPSNSFEFLASVVQAWISLIFLVDLVLPFCERFFFPWELLCFSSIFALIFS